MENKSLRPDLACHSIIIKNCTQSTAYFVGRRIHEEMKADPFRKWMLRDIQIQTKWIHFYGKCAEIAVCERIFKDIERIHADRIYSKMSPWTAMIAAYGRNGEMCKVRALYKRVLGSAISQCVDRKFFILVLNACSHCDDIELAQKVWTTDLRTDDRMRFDSFVVTAAVDCFSRKGRVQEARAIIDEFEYHQNHVGRQRDDVRSGADAENERAMWMALLAGTKTHCDLKMTRDIFAEIESRFKELRVDEDASSGMKGAFSDYWDCDKLDSLLSRRI